MYPPYPVPTPAPVRSSTTTAVAILGVVGIAVIDLLAFLLTYSIRSLVPNLLPILVGATLVFLVLIGAVSVRK